MTIRHDAAASAGTDAAGTDAAGTDAAGTDAAGTDAADSVANASVLDAVSMPSPHAARQTQGHRRPSGAPPPLPRHLGRTGKVWLIGAALLMSWIIIATFSTWARRV